MIRRFLLTLALACGVASCALPAKEARAICAVVDDARVGLDELDSAITSSLALEASLEAASACARPLADECAHEVTLRVVERRRGLIEAHDKAADRQAQIARALVSVKLCEVR